MSKRRVRSTLIWTAAAALSTTGMFLFRSQLDKSHVALVYLLVVLGAASQDGLRLGLTLAVVTFLSFNFFFLPPYHTFSIAEPMDWLILAAYLITASIAAALLTRAEREAADRIRLAAEAEHAKTLKEADRLKDAVLAAVSHDLRTPLTNIKALAHEIATEGDDRAEVIGTEADRLNRFVVGLLDLSALNSGALRINLEVNTVEDLVGATIAQLAPLLGARTLNTHLGEGEVLIGRFDFVYTVRILTNLLENAHKYSPMNSAIDIRAQRSGSVIELAVSDRGPGVPESERDRIFQSFYRPEGAPPDVASAGLGLAIAQRLAEAQGGKLRFEPRRAGGSTFILSLPAADLPEPEPLTFIS